METTSTEKTTPEDSTPIILTQQQWDDKVKEGLDVIFVGKKGPIPMTPETKARLEAVAERFKDRECFPEAIARAKESLKGLQQPDWRYLKFPGLFK